MGIVYSNSLAEVLKTRIVNILQVGWQFLYSLSVYPHTIN